MRSDQHPGDDFPGDLRPRQQPEISFAAALRTSVRVWQAIVLRETRSRFGRNALGFLWALIEPAIFICLFILVRILIREKFPAFGENPVLFFASGIILYRYYSAIAGRSLSAISANQALLTYPIVRPADVIIARAALETFTMLLVTVIFWIILTLIEEQRVIFHPVTFMIAMAATTFLAWGVGVFNAVFARLVPTWQRIYPLFGLPLLISSGIFYLPISMSEEIKNLLVWNPILHCVEWVRVGIYLDYVPLLDRPYPIIFGAIALTLGLGMENLFRREILRQ
ncbi:MAG: ABC transporter permease [Hyphomicrobiales bacterium]|nr:ABC transporter permease [Hyphomicrobiales bacterium]